MLGILLFVLSLLSISQDKLKMRFNGPPTVVALLRLLGSDVLLLRTRSKKMREGKVQDAEEGNREWG